MSLQLRPTKQQLFDLRQIVELGNERLKEVYETLGRMETPTLAPSKLLAVVRGSLPDDGECLVRQLLAIHGIARQTGRSVDDVVVNIRSAVERQGADIGLNPTDWLNVEETLTLLVKAQCVRLTATALELAYDYTNLLRRSKILTDIRPVFSDDAEKIDAAVVSYALRLHYSCADGEKELSLALDEADLKNLAAQCNRAIKKAATSRSLMVDRCDIPVTVPGESDDI